MRIYSSAELPQHFEDGTANPEWLAMHNQKFTGSNFYVFMSLLKKGELTDTAESVLYEKALASIEEPEPTVVTAAMERGTMLESVARDAYMAETFEDVREVGFVDFEELRAGCSPDGCVFVGDKIEKIIEIKCPAAKNYIKMAKGKLPTQYEVQVQYNLFVTGAKSCDFVVYHPAFKLSVQNIKPDEKMQADIRAVLEKLNGKYDEILADIKEFRK
jgi:putative phage-type endonuclease